MQIEVCDKEKTVYYWLSKEEKDDMEFRESLKPDFVKWNKKGYRVVNFLSGTEDLVKNTTDLLVNHMHVMARERVRKRKDDWER